MRKNGDSQCQPLGSYFYSLCPLGIAELLSKMEYLDEN